MADPFVLHPQLANDCLPVVDLNLSIVLLMNDRRFPWLILVPQRPGLRDFHEIVVEDRATLFREIEACSNVLLELPNITKMNVAALGNQVPQLHVHVIGRSTQDVAWPGPVWGVGESQPYPQAECDALIKRMAGELT